MYSVYEDTKNVSHVLLPFPSPSMLHHHFEKFFFSFVTVVTFFAIITFFIALIIVFWPVAGYTAISDKIEVSVDYVGIPRFILTIGEAVILIILCIEYIKHDLTAPIPAIAVAFD